MPAVRSAEVIVPLLLAWFAPASVVDVGCGRGAFLSVCKTHGVTDILGIDGDHHPAATRLIADHEFVAADLHDPPPLERRFDLAVCTEVAEHLDAADADRFVRYLTTLAPVVAFSAAIPDQGGVHHVNEQWPAYWSARFATHGYRPVDALRPRLWNDERVAFWYAQNLVLFVAHDLAGVDAAGVDAFPLGPDGSPLPLVHPRLLDAYVTRSRRPAAPPSLRALLRRFPRATLDAVARRRRGSTPTR